MQKVLIILRGLPGSGKSTLAKSLKELSAAAVFSVDDFFTNPESGAYQFDFKNNHLAYKSCQERTENAMQLSEPLVILDNTFTEEWEMEPYFKLAARYGYQVHVVTVENRHNGQNIHCITDEQLEKMAARYTVVLK